VRAWPRDITRFSRLDSSKRGRETASSIEEGAAPAGRGIPHADSVIRRDGRDLFAASSRLDNREELSDALAIGSLAHAADDWTWTFVSGKYSVTAGDCRHLAKGQPFSKNLAKQINSEVLKENRIASIC